MFLRDRPVTALSVVMRSALCISGLLFVGGVMAAGNDAEKEQAPPWYEVEIVVLEHLGSGPGSTNERWSDSPGMPAVEQGIELKNGAQELARAGVDLLKLVADAAGGGDGKEASPPNVELPAYYTLPKALLRLNKVERSLKRSRNYRPLLHVGWRQPVVDRERAASVHVYGDDLLPLESTDDGLVSQKTMSQSVPLFTDQPVDGGIAAPPRVLDGTVRLSVARYLHLDVDLLFRRLESVTRMVDVVTPPLENSLDDALFSSFDAHPKVPATTKRALTETRIHAYRLMENRRMRSGEVHHLDHPFFAVIALVTPYEPPIAEVEKASEAVAVPITTVDETAKKPAASAP
ncbi:MAG: hypothetical protein GXP10_06970 [Gammaproteobacteria bacterium]|nr:hypothetical protein [Gammaproteobacteria bacterium]